MSVTFTVLTISMEQSPSSEANSHSASQIACLYWTWRLITVLTRAHHRLLSWDRWMQPTLSHLISLRPIYV